MKQALESEIVNQTNKSKISGCSREQLIKNLRACDEGSVFGYAAEAADMLEFDAKEFNKAGVCNECYERYTTDNSR